MSLPLFPNPLTINISLLATYLLIDLDMFLARANNQRPTIVLEWGGNSSWQTKKVDAERSPELLAESKTCFRELILPVHNSFTAFKEMMTKTLTYGSKGFSMV